ncbi:ATP-binding protein [Basilea psittacipulmonis]|uniref:ATPase AAA n=1 Tax=Basilea psittacipulmonis DSM 24701 TaxID=1072685 RepID=A0A077DCC7_9BURK|nr:ATP-binding protein [Basilea psittacipulmonis]AIL32264.1 ATPase AAA [Basilea psittacipulmonis DSM 24701]
MQKSNIELLINKALTVLSQLEHFLPPLPTPTDWNAKAFRWEKKGHTAYLAPIHHLALIHPEDLHFVDKQKEAIDQNTYQFLQGLPANNVLMTGSRGTGKSSLVKAMLDKYANKGLRLIEIDKSDLKDLNQIITLVSGRPEKFIIFCDDLSFEEGEAGYKELKSILDGSVSASTENILIYATSNRRHLMPEKMQDNLDSHYVNGDLHPSESIEEKVSLSERFGLWLTFYSFTQDEYLNIVDYWLRQLNCPEQHISASHTEALQWATQRGSRSGRIARHFAKYWTAKYLQK